MASPEKTHYELLKTPTDQLDGERMLEEYVKNTDYIIGRLDGSLPAEGSVLSVDKEKLIAEGTVEFAKTSATEVEGLKKPDAVLWLDKSARPVSWMVKELWSQLVTKEPNGSIPGRPKDLFLNIDRLPWLRRSGLKDNEIDADSTYQFQINKIGSDNNSVKKQLGNIRGLFVQTKRKDENGTEIRLTPENFEDEVWNMPLIGSDDSADKPFHLLVVDEVKSSGATLNIAQQLLSAALPEITVTTAHWGTGKSAKTTKSSKGWVPVWYDADTEAGRGVGDVNETWYENSDLNWRHKLGAAVLSTTYRDRKTGERKKDAKTDMLRSDIKKLSKALLAKEVLYRPASQRGKQGMIERIYRIGGMSTDKYRQAIGVKPKTKK